MNKNGGVQVFDTSLGNLPHILDSILKFLLEEPTTDAKKMNNRINILRFSLISHSFCSRAEAYKKQERKMLEQQRERQRREQLQQQQDQDDRLPPLQSTEMFRHMIAQGYAPASMMWVATDVTERDIIEGMRVEENMWSGALNEASGSPTPQALWILKKSGVSVAGTHLLELAAESGRLYNLLFFVQNGVAVTAKALEKAAVNGHRRCLQLLLQSFPTNIPSIVIARTAASGHVDCLKAIMTCRNGIQSASDAVVKAASSGHTKCLGYLLTFIEHAPDEAIIAASKGNKECLLMLLPKMTLVPSDAVVIAAAGHDTCLKVLLMQLSTMDLVPQRAFVSAIENSDTCLKLLLEHAKKHELTIPEEAVTTAAAGYYESLNMLIEYKAQINQSAVNAAACHFSCLSVLLRAGRKATREAVIEAAAGFYSCLKLLLEHVDENCISAEAATAAAAYYPCLQLLIERRAPISERTVVAAAGHFDCLSLVLQKTKVLSARALSTALEMALNADSYDCVRTILTFAQSEFLTEAVPILVQWCRSTRTLANAWSLLKKLNSKVAWPNSTCKTLIKRDRDDLLVFVVTNGAKCTTSTLEKAVRTGNFRCYLALHNRIQLPMGKIECELAVAGGDIEILKHMHRVMRVPWGKTSTLAAVKGLNHFLEYAFNNGNKPANETAWGDLAETAARNGHLHTLQLFADYGCDIKADRVLFAAAEGNQFDLCLKLVQLGAKVEEKFIAHIGGLYTNRSKNFPQQKCAELLGAVDEDGYIITWAITENKKGCFLFAASNVPLKPVLVHYWVKLLKAKKRKGWIEELPEDSTLFLGYRK